MKEPSWLTDGPRESRQDTAFTDYYENLPDSEYLWLKHEYCKTRLNDLDRISEKDFEAWLASRWESLESDGPEHDD